MMEEKVFIYGPTHIYNKDTYIYTENGWYNTKKEIVQFNKNGFIKNKKQRISGDSIYFDKKRGYGNIFGHVNILDSTESVVIKGNKAFYFEKPEKAIVTGDAVLIQYGQPNDSLFLHADTLKSEFDSTGLYKIIKAYYKAQAYKSDFQIRCDSMAYSLKDSIIYSCGNPTMWSTVYQITADSIAIHLKNKQINFVALNENCMIISKQDSSRFNQIKGISMKAYFQDNEPRRIDVNKNGNSLYYVPDSKEIIGMNKTECSSMKIFIKNKKIQNVVFYTKPTATLYPLKDIKPELSFLEGFNWLISCRPQSSKDIFKWKDCQKQDKKTNNDKDK
jgi:lipopolysaccharide export system protein LptA